MPPEPIAAIRHVQQEYLRLLESYFVEEINAYEASGGDFNAYAAAHRFGQGEGLMVAGAGGAQSLFEFKVHEFLDDLRGFWDKHTPALHAALRALDGLSLSIWPEAGLHEQIPRLLTYFDTVLIADPIPNFLADAVQTGAAPPQAKYEVVYWVGLMRSLKGLILAETERPLVVVYRQTHRAQMPGFEVQDPTEAKSPLVRNTAAYTVALFREALAIDEPVTAMTDLVARAMRLSPGALNRNMAQVGQLLQPMLTGLVDDTPVRPSRSEAAGFNLALRDRLLAGKILRSDLPRVLAATAAAFYAVEMREANSQDLGADNQATDRTWNALRWRNDYLARQYRLQLKLDESQVVANSFLKRFRWLSNVGLDDILRLREAGDLEGLRAVFRVSRQRLKRASIADFDQLSAELEVKVTDAINEQIAQEQDVLAAIHRRTRNTLISFGVTVGLGAASFAFPALLPLAVASTVFGVAVGSASLKDVLDQHLSGQRELAGVSQRPISFLVDQYKKGRHRKQGAD